MGDVKVCLGCGCVLVIGDNIPSGRYAHRNYRCNTCHKNHLQHKPLPEGDRFCRVCNSKLIVGDNWYKSQAIRGSNICKTCHLEWERDYKNKNRDAINKTRRNHYRINQPRLYKQTLKWREEHPEKVKEIEKRYKENHKDRIKEIHRISIAKHYDKYKIRLAKWREDNKEYLSNYDKLYRAQNQQLVRCWKASWYSANPEKVKEMDRRKYLKQRHARIEAYLKYRQKRVLLHQLLEVTA